MLHARFPGFLHPRTTSVHPPGRRRRPATRRRTSLIATCGAVALAVVAALTATSDAAAVGHHAHVAARPAAAKPAAKQSGPLFVHDPSMAKEKGTYYLFSTGDPAGTLGNGNIQIRTSPNLKDWTYTGTVFATKPAWITDALGNIPNLWAPDISFFNGLWHLYYAGSSFGSNNSVIGLATTPTLDPRSPNYHWTDRGLVFRTSSSDNFNAIDPALVSDASGGKWLALGSFWSGIKIIRLDPKTGMPAESTPTVHSIASKPFPDPEEGASITYHDGFYYLFVSVDYCCRGINSTYHIQVGRSTSVTGPYTDAAGTDMTNGGGTEVQGTDAGMIGPGGESVFRTRDGRDLLVYHYYDAFSNGDAWVQIRPLSWVNGWPVTGEPIVPVPGQ